MQGFVAAIFPTAQCLFYLYLLKAGFLKASLIGTRLLY